MQGRAPTHDPISVAGRQSAAIDARSSKGEAIESAATPTGTPVTPPIEGSADRDQTDQLCGNRRQGLVLGYAAFDEAILIDGVSALSDVLNR